MDSITSAKQRDEAKTVSHHFCLILTYYMMTEDSPSATQCAGEMKPNYSAYTRHSATDWQRQSPTSVFERRGTWLLFSSLLLGAHPV